MRMFNSSGRRSHKSHCHDAGHSRNHSEAFARKFASDSKMTGNLMRRLRSNGGYALVFVVVAMTMALAIVGGISASSVTNMKRQQAAAKKMEDRYDVAGDVEKVFAQISEVEPETVKVDFLTAESLSSDTASSVEDIEKAKNEDIENAKSDAATQLKQKIVSNAGIADGDIIYDPSTETFTVNIVKSDDSTNTKAKIDATLTVNVKYALKPQETETDTNPSGGTDPGSGETETSPPSSDGAPDSSETSTPSEGTDGSDSSTGLTDSSGGDTGDTPATDPTDPAGPDANTDPETALDLTPQICTATISGITYTDYEVTYGEETESEGGT